MAKTIYQVLDDIRAKTQDEKTKGAVFERLIQRWLAADPFYAARYDAVWLWSEFPARAELGSVDLGIDLVAHRADGGYAAIQCKFYAPGSLISKEAVDSFVSHSSHLFHDPLADPEGQRPQVPFAERVWVSTTEHFGKNAREALQNLQPPVEFVYLTTLADSDVDWERLLEGDPVTPKPKPTPRDYQQVIVDAAVRHYETNGNDRGLLVMACGTGKTLTSLFIAERLASVLSSQGTVHSYGDPCQRESGSANCPGTENCELGTENSQLVLFLAPSIALVSQSMRCWVACASQPIGAICVCSDPRAGETRDPSAAEDNDSLRESLLDLPVASCTDPQRIAAEIARLRKLHKMVVVFSTYQSIGAVHCAINSAQFSAHGSLSAVNSYPGEGNTGTEHCELGTANCFDLVICDEAHRTSSVIQNEWGWDDQSDFTRVHDNDYLPARRRLYMTATPRIYSEANKAKAKIYNDILMSMDDEDIYGKNFYTLSFGTAVDKGLLTDYKVMVLTIDPAIASAEFLNAVNLPAEDDAQEHDDIDDEEQKERAEHRQTAIHHITPEQTAMLLGTLAALSKQVTTGTSDPFAEQSPEERAEPLHTCIAFCDNVHRTRKTRAGRYVTSETAFLLGHIAEKYREKLAAHDKLDSEAQDYIDHLATVRANSVSGEMDTNERNLNLQILRNPTASETHVVCNVNCLSEGVDVPALDSIVFLAAKSSPITLIQSVGRVMRRFEGKKYGYVIIPIVVPMGQSAEEQLDKNERFKLVWDVLNALRSHDERLAAELSNHSYRHVAVVHPNPAPTSGPGPHPGPKPGPGPDPVISQLQFDFDDKLYTRMVDKVGDRYYWANWSKRVGTVAHNFIERIRELIAAGKYHDEMEALVRQLRQSVNSSITTDDAVTFLSQHLVTRPVFDALFADYRMEVNNPVSRTMGQMVDLLEGEAFVDDRRVLDDFCDNVRQVCGSLDDLAKKQEMVRTLYEQFFKNAFPKTTEQLGIVYTPVECVDFIIRSVDDILRRDFALPEGLATPGLRCLDPFAGTGTFTVRALQYLRQRRRLPLPALLEKYRHDFLSFEIVLLSYYIADVNIESAFNSLVLSATEKKTRDAAADTDTSTPATPPYEFYDGICLTDTFAITENRAELPLPGLLAENTRVAEQTVTPDPLHPLTVIWGNPPYSVGQKSANDNAQNLKYKILDQRIAETYARQTASQNKNSLYDTYIKAFRWATDRIAEQHRGQDAEAADTGGIVAFISNGAWIDGNSQDGMRRCLEAEWTDIYIYHLKGNCRTSGELRRREGDGIFDQGSRTPIAITILVRRPGPLPAGNRAAIHFAEVDDYLSRKQKLQSLSRVASVLSPAYADIDHPIVPNDKGDWINQRDGEFEKLVAIGDKDGIEGEKTIFLPVYSRGLATARDAWCYQFSKKQLAKQISESIDFYNEQRIAYHENGQGQEPKEFVKYDSSRFSWNRGSLNNLRLNKEIPFRENSIRISTYRPFVRQWCYFDTQMNDMTYQLPKLFPTPRHHNLVICVNSVGDTADFSCIITDVIPDLHVCGSSQCYPMYYYESREEYLGAAKKKGAAPTLPGTGGDEQVSGEALRAQGFDSEGYRRRPAVSAWAVGEACRRMGITRHQLAEARLGMAGQTGLLRTVDASGDVHTRRLGAEEEDLLCREAIFFYTYGALHDAEWRRRFAADLKKGLPRIEITGDAAKFRETAVRGETLARLQLWAASGEGDVADILPPAPAGMEIRVDGSRADFPLPAAAMRVGKMRFPSKTDRSTIFITDCVSLVGIPPEAYAYVVNGKSALEWVMERVALTQDKASGIVNDPNAWAAEHGEPDWAARLVWRVARASVAIYQLTVLTSSQF